MSITVDTILLKFNVKPSYEQQQIQQLKADLKQAEANYESIVKTVKENAKEHSRLYGEIAKVKAKRDELAKQNTLSEKEQRELVAYNSKIDDLTNALTKNEEQQSQLLKVSESARKEMVELQNGMNGVAQSTLHYNMTIQQLNERERELRMLLNNVDPSTEEWENYNKELSETKKRIAELRRQAPDFHDELKLEDMTIKQLNERISALRSALESCKPNTDEFREYSEALQQTESRLKEVTSKVQESIGKFSGGGFLKKIIGDSADVKGIMTFLTGNALFKVGEMAFGAIADFAGRAVNRVKELVTESVQAARAAQGISYAFDRINQPGLLDNLRKATHGTVTDIELMKAAVQAQDFRLPLDQLGKYLEFAQLKAQQTGQSVEYMTNSIVTGLGRKSVMILDNLGISASEIKEEMKEGGDMATAVGKIIDRQMTQAGEHFEDAAERETRATTEVSNAQLRLGQQMQKTFGIGSTSFGEMQAKAETFILNGLTKLIVFCQNLYDRLGTVRVMVETVKITFDTLFKVCEAGFYAIIDTVRIVGRTLMDLGGLIESVFTAFANRDFSPITHSWEVFTSNLDRGFTRLTGHMKDVGTRWGKNVIDSMNAVTGKAKIIPPSAPGLSTSQPVPDNPGKDKPDRTNTVSIPTTGTDDSFQKDLAAREQAYHEYEVHLKRMMANSLLTEEEYNQESLQAEREFLADKIALQELYGQDSLQTQEQFLDTLIRESNNKQKEAKQKLQAELDQAEAGHNAKNNELMRRQLEGELSTKEEYNRLKLQADIDYQRQRLEILRAAGADTTQAEQQLLQLQTQQYQQYQQNLSDTTQQEEDVRKRVREAAINAVNNLLSSSSQLFSAMQQREISQVEAKYKKLIDAAKKQGKDTTKLEEKLEKEKSDIQKKYAEKQFMLNVLQIVASTATGIARLWKDLPFYAALPLTAVVAASGAAQLASAKMAADQASGLYRGGYSDDYADTTVPAASPAGVEGYTKKGDPRKQAGFIPVHQSEFVANHKAVANPAVRPVLDVIDQHQRRGDIQLLDATRLLEEAYGRGRYRGGYTADGQLPSHVGEGPGVGSDSQFQSDVVPLLERIERNTARSLTVRSLRDEIAHEEQLERNARR